jgi:hypothetical protein
VKVGDLVRCNFQPRVGEYNKEKNGFIFDSMPTLKDKLGIIVKESNNYRSVPRFKVLFTHIGYEHTFVETVLERVSESR